MTNIPIFLPSDNNYAPFVATTMVSILENTKSFIDFYVLDSGITEENQEKICTLKEKYSHFSIEFLKIDVEKHFRGFDVPGYLNLSTYSRFLIPTLKPELGKVLYIDTDVVVLGDISELYAVDLEGFALGAAWDKSRKLYNTDTKDLIEMSNDYKYFNVGVLLIDVRKWIKDEVVKHLFAIQKKYDGKILHADETLLNKYFDGKYKVFDIKYDYIDYDVINRADIKPVIRHFATPMKPWNSNYCFAGRQVIPLAYFDDFWACAAKTPFYAQIKDMYKKGINKTPLTKRMSLIADQMKKVSCSDKGN